jgi:hypothetical protein
VKRAGWLTWLVCALLYPLACFVAWALRPSHRPGPWRPRARGVWLVCLAVLLATGCVGGAVGAAGGLVKALAVWDLVCPAGREALVAAASVARVQIADASTSAESDAAADAAERDDR